MLFEITHYKSSQAKNIVSEKCRILSNVTYAKNIFPKMSFQKNMFQEIMGRKKHSSVTDLCDANYGSKQTLKNHMGSKHAKEILRDLAFGTTD